MPPPRVLVELDPAAPEAGLAALAAAPPDGSILLRLTGPLEPAPVRLALGLVDPRRVRLSVVAVRAGQRLLGAALRRLTTEHPDLASVEVRLGAPLPDPEVLAAAIERARHGPVRVDTPAVPACVGDALGQGRRSPRAVDGHAFVAGCRSCTLRPVCGGAPAAWQALLESGEIPPPAPLVEPWEPGAPGALQTVVRAAEPDATAKLQGATTPTVWWWTERISAADLALPFTHLALELPAASLDLDTLARLPLVGRPVHVALTLGPMILDITAIVELLANARVTTLALLAPEVWVDAELFLRRRFPRLDVRRIGPPA